MTSREKLFLVDWIGHFKTLTSTKYGRQLTTGIRATQSRFLTAVKRTSVENILGKGENAGNNSVFSFSHNCFVPSPPQNSIFWSHLFCRLKWFQFVSVWNIVVWYRVNQSPNISSFRDSQENVFWKHYWKRNYTSIQHFLLLQQDFLICTKTNFMFRTT